ncbi:hypothetical protein PV646_41230 [Streptomyces sp. ID05-26A]|nr:hypothetical protein [Streptomyces sp. ID05-26A]
MNSVETNGRHVFVSSGGKALSVGIVAYASEEVSERLPPMLCTGGKLDVETKAGAAGTVEDQTYSLHAVAGRRNVRSRYSKLLWDGAFAACRVSGPAPSEADDCVLNRRQVFTDEAVLDQHPFLMDRFPLELVRPDAPPRRRGGRTGELDGDVHVLAAGERGSAHLGGFSVSVEVQTRYRQRHGGGQDT